LRIVFTQQTRCPFSDGPGIEWRVGRSFVLGPSAEVTKGENRCDLAARPEAFRTGSCRVWFGLLRTRVECIRTRRPVLVETVYGESTVGMRVTIVSVALMGNGVTEAGASRFFVLASAFACVSGRSRLCLSDMRLRWRQAVFRSGC